MLSERTKRIASWVSGIIPLLGAIIAVTFWVDDRYAHAMDFERNMAKNNLVTQESLIELRLEQNAYQTRNIARRLSGSPTPELDQQEMEDLRVNREALRKRQHDIRMQLQMLK